MSQQGTTDAKEVTFQSPMINLYTEDVMRLVRFYEGIGFSETFRTPKDAEPLHVEVRLDGFTLAVSSVEAAITDHGVTPNLQGRPIGIVLWTNDTDAAYARLVSTGAPSLNAPHNFLDDRLRVAWVTDPDGNPIELVQRIS